MDGWRGEKRHWEGLGRGRDVRPADHSPGGGVSSHRYVRPPPSVIVTANELSLVYLRENGRGESRIAEGHRGLAEDIRTAKHIPVRAERIDRTAEDLA